MNTCLKRCITLWLALCFAGLMFFAVVPSAMAAKADDLIATGCNYPTTLKEGQSFGLKGVVSSEKTKIVRLVAGVFNESGKMVTGRSWNPNAKSIDLRWYVNPYVKFGTLSAGTYTYKITATNGSMQKTLLSKTFEVTPKPPVPDDLKASGCNYPTTLIKGKGFALRGVITSQTSNITKLSVGVYDKDGKMLTGRSWNPKAKIVDLKWAANPFVKFGKLTVGTYTYKITVKNASGQKTLVNEEFEVLAPEPVSDDLSATGCNYPTSLEKGKGFALRGVVRSQSSKITKLTAGVFDENNKMLTGRSWNPKAKSVDLKWSVNPFVKFGKLAVGTYTYKIIATNAAGQETLLSEEFEVTPPAPVPDKLVGSSLNAPKLLIKGRGFALKGIVSSQTSKIKNLTAGVFDSEDNMLTGRSWNPKAKSVDLRWYVNPYVKFGTLAVGTYTYKVIATNDAGTKTLLEAEFEVVK